MVPAATRGAVVSGAGMRVVEAWRRWLSLFDAVVCAQCQLVQASTAVTRCHGWGCHAAHPLVHTPVLRRSEPWPRRGDGGAEEQPG